MHASVDIMLELTKNILNFSYRISFKDEGMLSHSFDRFCVMKKFVLPKIEDLKFTTVILTLAVNIGDKGRKRTTIHQIIFQTSWPTVRK